MGNSSRLQRGVGGGLPAGTTTASIPDSTDSRYCTDAQKAKLTAMSRSRVGTIPAFASNAATITPGNDKASEYIHASTLTLAANATLTVSVTNAVAGSAFLYGCRALAPGYTISIANDGPQVRVQVRHQFDVLGESFAND